MRFDYDRTELEVLEEAEKNCVLLTNGLGGFLSQTAAWSVNRNDQGILISADHAPNERTMLIHRIKERICVGQEQFYLSSQTFAGGRQTEDGFTHLQSLTVDRIPVWDYAVANVSVNRTCCMVHGENTTALLWKIRNGSRERAVLKLKPCFTFQPKGLIPEKMPILSGEIGPKHDTYGEMQFRSGSSFCRIRTNGSAKLIPAEKEMPYYAYDERDGRQAQGLAFRLCEISLEIEAGQERELWVLAGGAGEVPAYERTTDVEQAEALFLAELQRCGELIRRSGFRDPIAQQLAVSAADFISAKEASGGQTILAGYPFFGDWGRDTMISLPGCVLALGMEAEAKQILETFLKFEKDGLIPNMFPDGQQDPMYNTVDASLLLILQVQRVFEQTGDLEFLQRAWPVMKRIVAAYRKGTHYGIHMDEDGLIAAGFGTWQLTWMDVCVDGFLPTPRHGKPVEINAYWYSVLRTMEQNAKRFDELVLAADLGDLAERCRKSFREQFWMEEEGYLKDVISGTPEEKQIRCNQIWAVTMPYTMLDEEQERRVVETVYRHLYTPQGLRTLSPEDPAFRPVYQGSIYERDTAYHQGTVWPFPLGAWYLAYLKVHAYSAKACEWVRKALKSQEMILREGCIGQLAEIYDGLEPETSRGCFAQAWSVGELLRVWKKLEEV